MESIIDLLHSTYYNYLLSLVKNRFIPRCICVGNEFMLSHNQKKQFILKVFHKLLFEWIVVTGS